MFEPVRAGLHRSPDQLAAACVWALRVEARDGLPHRVDNAQRLVLPLPETLESEGIRPDFDRSVGQKLDARDPAPACVEQIALLREMPLVSKKVDHRSSNVRMRDRSGGATQAKRVEAILDQHGPGGRAERGNRQRLPAGAPIGNAV